MDVNSKHTDQELVALLKEGDHAAFAEIYDRYNGPLYLFAYNRLRDREEAKDSIHELFLKLWDERLALPDASNVAAYLYAALRNRIINLVAHQKVAGRYLDSFREFAESHPVNDTDHLVRHNELQAFIDAEIAALHPRMRQVFELSRNTKMTRREIAEALGVSEETVKSHMHGALKVLKLRLGNMFMLLF